ncbi:hypothetical protein RND71_042770 [Anisodus tanguticus]|uniref:Uncharacterized protein n=1 Tax=Anisodus tanguticus TaxID=243964 RepID=A0AAE1QSZ0_9SOLA|nr:hypothetical protein RND71_042770 [Anisodus tanguticus]
MKEKKMREKARGMTGGARWLQRWRRGRHRRKEEKKWLIQSVVTICQNITLSRDEEGTLVACSQFMVSLLSIPGLKLLDLIIFLTLMPMFPSFLVNVRRRSKGGDT